jgi:hypothetical protein
VVLVLFPLYILLLPYKFRCLPGSYRLQEIKKYDGMVSCSIMLAKFGKNQSSQLVRKLKEWDTAWGSNLFSFLKRGKQAKKHSEHI